MTINTLTSLRLIFALILLSGATISYGQDLTAEADTSEVVDLEGTVFTAEKKPAARHRCPLQEEPPLTSSNPCRPSASMQTVKYLSGEAPGFSYT